MGSEEAGATGDQIACDCSWHQWISERRRHRVPIDHMDVALFYRMFDHPFWPWYGKPKQVRRHFAHLGRLPAVF